jgi:hypothetical protein
MVGSHATQTTEEEMTFRRHFPKGRHNLNTEPVPIDLAMRDASLIAPVIRESGDDCGDPEEAMENAARKEEGLLRHGFRGLID